MQRDGKTFDGICPNQVRQKWTTAVTNKTDKVLVPRSSSPVTVYVEFPCVIERAFSTIAWDDLEEGASLVRQESDSFGCQATKWSSLFPRADTDKRELITRQRENTLTEMTTNTFSSITSYCPDFSWWDFQVNKSDANDQDFGEYGLDFIAASPTTLESSLSSAELVPFQEYVIPPLTPQQNLSSEDSLVNSSAETCNPPAQDGDSWKGIAECHGKALGHSIAVNKQLQESFRRQQEEIDCLEERNVHLRQLASRAKHLASVLEKLMTVRDLNVKEPVMPYGGDKTSLSPCKRQRLDEGYETESSDSVDDMLRDISTRCNAVLHSRSTETRLQQESETICMYGAFSGLQTSIAKHSNMTVDAAEAGESVSSFRTSVREHSTIRTQVFTHGHAFTSRTQQGGYRFRWVPKQS